MPNMKKRILGILTALALVSPVWVVATTTTAEAGSLYYSSCTKLTKRYPHGVAKGYKAAMKQVRQGYGRPAYGTRAKKVYWKNYKRLDRDRDGTACER